MKERRRKTAARKQALNEDELLINDYLREFCRLSHTRCRADILPASQKN